MLVGAHAHLHTHWPLRSLIKKPEHPIHIYHLVIRELRPSTSSLPGGMHHSNQPPASLTSIIPDQHWVAVIQHTQSHSMTQHALMWLTPLFPNSVLTEYCKPPPLLLEYFVVFNSDSGPFLFLSVMQTLPLTAGDHPDTKWLMEAGNWWDSRTSQKEHDDTA